MKIGDKVEYQIGDKWKKGVVHGVRSYEDSKSKKLNTTYLVDTGKDEHVDEFVTEKGKDNIFVRQPEQVEVTQENIRATK